MTERSRLSVGEAPFVGGAGRLRVSLLGAGRVGTAFARGLAGRGHRILSVAASSLRSAEVAAARFGAQATSAAAVSEGADLVILAVPDDALERAIDTVASGVGPDARVVHTCGTYGAAPLARFGERGAAVHPAAPIASGEASLEGIAFGVTCADATWPFAAWLAGELGGVPVRVPEEGRVLYHAALVIGSNFTASLAADAIALAGRDVVLPLLRATLANVSAMPAADALTGPVVRGDAGTVRAHVEALKSAAPPMLETYVAVSRRLLAQALAAGRLDEAGRSRIEEALDS